MLPRVVWLASVAHSPVITGNSVRKRFEEKLSRGTALPGGEWDSMSGGQPPGGSSLRAHRVLVEKSEGIDGGNRVADFTYRCSIENFGNTPVRVQLYDRLPQTKNTAREINIIAGTSAKGPGDKPLGPKEPLDKALSQDPLYLQKDRKLNILRWDLDVPANSVEDKAYTMEYQFTLAYDKNLIIATPVIARGGVVGGVGGAAAPSAAPVGQNQQGGGFGGGGAGRGAGGGRGGR